MLGILLDLTPEEPKKGGRKGGREGGREGGRLSYFLNGKPTGAVFENIPLSSAAAAAGEEGGR